VCGICGTIGLPVPSSVEGMLSDLEHRGPDDRGVFTDGEFALGATRLSIIDPDGGHQPLSNEDGTVWAALNGEIYNHPSLREHLAERGHRFATKTDTEVLVHLYEDYGEALVHAIEGMFALAIWDARDGSLFLARDRFGEKPLFYSDFAAGFAFASELRPLLRALPHSPEPDPGAVDSFFVFGYVAGSASIVVGIDQLPPGHCLSRRPGGQRELRRYWHPPVHADSAPPDGAAELEAEALLERSVRSRMIADAPVGVLLSGGVDSTLIAAMSAEASTGPLRTYSVGYASGRVNEIDQARRVASLLATDHRELVLDDADAADRVPAVLRAIDQPIADPALVPTEALASLAAREVKVLVGGEGADELFGGYPRYRWLDRAERLEALPDGVRRSSAHLISRIPGRRSARLSDVLRPSPTVGRHIDWVTGGRRHTRADLYGPRLQTQIKEGWAIRRLSDSAEACGGRETSAAARFMALDQIDWLPDDVLAKADRATMLASVELRTPYLNHELAELCATVPAAVHVRGRGKAWLRAMLRRRTSKALASSPKTAFRVPIAEWLRGPLEPFATRQLRSGPLVEQGWFAREPVEHLLTAHLAGADHSQALWPLLCLATWLEATCPDG
jgi:asparagine synthase (glutamine-hydrolysing)